MLDMNAGNLKEAGVATVEESKKQTVLGDSNFFSEDNLRACDERELEAIIPDSQMSKKVNPQNNKRYETSDFTYHEAGDYFICPQGNRLIFQGATKLRGREGKRYYVNTSVCRACSELSRCIRTGNKTDKIKHGRSLLITRSNEPGSLCQAMREKLVKEEYQDAYAYRIQIVEPVFANIKHCKGLNRFTLRGKQKVNGQWLLYCIVHNLGKCLDGFNAGRKTA